MDEEGSSSQPFDKKLLNDFDDESAQSDDEHGDAKEDEPPSKKTKKVHKLSLKKTEDYNEKLKKRGVIYVARIPPRMTPTKLKALLSDFGEITRVFCEPEDAAKRKRRQKLSGNGSKRYVEGWVEFESKSIAKRVAQALHQQPITNYKRSHFYGDLWNVKYLKGFKWSHLTEKVAYERRVREQKLRLETMQARRETADFKRLLETGKVLDKIEQRKRKRGESENVDSSKAGRNKASQIRPLSEGSDKPGHKGLLGALV